MKQYQLIVSVLFSVACNILKKEPDNEFCSSGAFYQPVEQISIWDTGKINQFNGKFIQLDGILHYSFEDVALYPIGSKRLEDAFWLDLRVPKEVSEKDLEELYGKKIKIIGRVNLSKKGHLGAYRGTLDSAFCIKQNN